MNGRRNLTNCNVENIYTVYGSEYGRATAAAAAVPNIQSNHKRAHSCMAFGTLIALLWEENFTINFRGSCRYQLDMLFNQQFHIWHGWKIARRQPHSQCYMILEFITKTQTTWCAHQLYWIYDPSPHTRALWVCWRSIWSMVVVGRSPWRDQKRTTIWIP